MILTDGPMIFRFLLGIQKNEVLIRYACGFMVVGRSSSIFERSAKSRKQFSKSRFNSVVSLVEIRIKQKIGKLTGIPDNLIEILHRSQFDMLDFTADHASAIGGFEYFHRDPFDWMLIAQARVEDLTLITHDNDIQKYEVKFLKT